MSSGGTVGNLIIAGASSLYNNVAGSFANGGAIYVATQFSISEGVSIHDNSAYVISPPSPARRANKHSWSHSHDLRNGSARLASSLTLRPLVSIRLSLTCQNGGAMYITTGGHGEITDSFVNDNTAEVRRAHALPNFRCA